MKRISLAPDLSLDPGEIAGKSFAVFGTTGSGKSTTTRKLLEELVKVGFPFSVADIDNEYAALKELGDIILAGPSVDHGRIKNDVTLTNFKQCYALGRRAYKERRNVILLLADLDDDTRKLFLEAYCRGLFEAGADPEHRCNHVLVLEEAQEYIPQVGIAKDDPLRVAVIRIGKRGRKRGIALGIVSQRPANVDKDVVTMCQFFLAHFVTYATDINTYKNILPFKNIEERMPSMAPGDVWFMLGKKQAETHITEPKTSSPSTTPGAIDPSRFKTVLDAESIEAEVSKIEDREGTSVVPTEYLRTLEEQVPKLQGALREAIETIQEVESEIEVLRNRESTASGPVPEDVLKQLANAERKLAHAEAWAAPMRLIVGLMEDNRGQI